MTFYLRRQELGCLNEVGEEDTRPNEIFVKPDFIKESVRSRRTRKMIQAKKDRKSARQESAFFGGNAILPSLSTRIKRKEIEK